MSFLPLYAADAHQDFYMRIAMRISAYADHPHEPHGSATAWPTLVAVVSGKHEHVSHNHTHIRAGLIAPNPCSKLVPVVFVFLS